MSEFGLTNDKYTRSDYKELHQHMDDAVEEITDDIKLQSSNVITQTHNDTEHIDAWAEKKAQIEKIKVNRLIAKMNFNNHVTNSKLDEQYESLSKVLTGLSAKMI